MGHAGGALGRVPRSAVSLSSENFISSLVPSPLLQCDEVGVFP